MLVYKTSGAKQLILPRVIGNSYIVLKYCTFCATNFLAIICKCPIQSRSKQLTVSIAELSEVREFYNCLKI